MATIHRSKRKGSAFPSSYIDTSGIKIFIAIVMITFLASLLLLIHQLPDPIQLQHTLQRFDLKKIKIHSIINSADIHSQYNEHHRHSDHRHSGDFIDVDEYRSMEQPKPNPKPKDMQKQEDSTGQQQREVDSNMSRPIGNEEDKQFNFSHLFPFDEDIDKQTRNDLYQYVKSIRNPYYDSNPATQNLHHDIYNCPERPPRNYPLEYPLIDIK